MPENVEHSYQDIYVNYFVATHYYMFMSYIDTHQWFFYVDTGTVLIILCTVTNILFVYALALFPVLPNQVER